MKAETISLYAFYHFHPLHRHLDINWVIAADNSPLCIAGSWSLVQQLRLILALTFVPLSLEDFICGKLEDCIDLFNFHYRFFLFQNLYYVIPLLLWQFSKSVWAPFLDKLTQYIFLEVHI